MASEEDDIVDILARYYPPPTQKTIMISTSLIRAAQNEIVELREKLDRIGLACIEAANPGIDMEKVKDARSQLNLKEDYDDNPAAADASDS